MKQIIFEVCCGSLKDCLNAREGGANRIELNSSLFLGGLTPTTAVLDLAKKQIDLPIICMVRPRGGGFCYDKSEIETMFLEAKQLLEHGADGIAFGFLTEESTVDTYLTKKMVSLIHSYGKEAVFHRAYDCVKNPFFAIENLISASVNRVLTSGLSKTALEGQGCLRQLQEKYGNQIEILAGCGIRQNNVLELLQATNLSQVHSSARVWFQDVTTNGTEVSYAFSDEGDYDGVSFLKVKEIATQLRRI